MHNGAPHTSGSTTAHSVVQTLMSNYEKLDRLERILSDIISTPPTAYGAPVQPLTGLLDKLRVAGLISPTDHFSGHCNACSGLQAVKYIRANVLALMRELAAQAIAASVPGAVEEVDLAVVATHSAAAMQTFSAAPAAPR